MRAIVAMLFSAPLLLLGSQAAAATSSTPGIDSGIIPRANAFQVAERAAYLQTIEARQDESSSASTLPLCAEQCMASALAASPCNATDVACQCTDATFTSSSTACVASSCTVEESLLALNASATACGVPPRDRSGEYTVVSTTLMAVACAVVLLRLGYTVFLSPSGVPGMDDWFILATVLVCVPSAVINVTELSANGLGRDIWTLTPEQITGFARGFWVITLLYFTEVFVLKLALLFFYLRIFPAPGVRRLLWITVGFDVLFGLSFVLAALLQCRPISFNWTSWRGAVPENAGGQCADISVIAWCNAAVSIALDLWMLALPLWQLRGLRLKWRKKIGVASMFCVGTFVTVISAVRLGSLITFRGSANLTWDYWGVSLWSTVEITVGVICACMPALRLLLIRIAPRVFGTTAATNSSYAHGAGGAKGSGYYASRSARKSAYYDAPGGGGTGGGGGGNRASMMTPPSALKINRRTSVRITEDDSDSLENIILGDQPPHYTARSGDLHHLHHQNVSVGGGVGMPLRSLSRQDSHRKDGSLGLSIERVEEEEGEAGNSRQGGSSSSSTTGRTSTSHSTRDPAWPMGV